MRTIKIEDEYFVRGPNYGIPLGLELMSKYVAALISNPDIIGNSNIGDITWSKQEIIDYAERLTELTIEKWNDADK